MQISLDSVGDDFLHFSVTCGLQGLNNKSPDPRINPTEDKLCILHLKSKLL